MLTPELTQQLKAYLQYLQNPVVFHLDAGDSDNGQKMQTFVETVAGLDPRLSVVAAQLKRQPSFAIDPKDGVSGIEFAGIPMGHEFESFVLALLQVSGHAPKITAQQQAAINAIKTPLHFETYASLSCHNCPDVVQALDIISVLNPQVSHTMIDGGMFQQETEAKNIMAVPTVYLNGEEWHNGRASLDQLLAKIAGHTGPQAVAQADVKRVYDVLIVGGGPAAGTAALYAARKGLAVAIVATTIGGQPLETADIENVPGTDHIQGEQLMQNLQAQLTKYQVTQLAEQTVTGLIAGTPLTVQLAGDTQLQAKIVVIATGAHWRNLNVPGEAEFKNRGVAYCPHCDGPLYRDKAVAVVGGGNSGIEAAIDLAGIAKHVTVLEYAAEISADAVLTKKAHGLANVDLVANAQTTAIKGDGRVSGVTYTDRATGAAKQLTVDGVFVQIGLVPNTDWLADTLELNAHHEVVVDARGATSMKNVFAAGDCTNSAYKQIVIAMGMGATAALSAFDALVRQS